MNVWPVFKRPKHTNLGMVISHATIRVVEIMRENNDFCVVSQGLLAIPSTARSPEFEGNKDFLCKLIDDMLRLLESQCTRATLAVSESGCVIRHVQVPSELTGHQLHAALHVEAAQYFPFMMDDAAFDYRCCADADVPKTLQSVTLAGCRQQSLVGLNTALEASTLNDYALDVEDLAIERAYRMLPCFQNAKTGGAAGIIDVADRYLKVLVVFNGKLLYSRKTVVEQMQADDRPVQLRHRASVKNKLMSDFPSCPDLEDTIIAAWQLYQSGSPDVGVGQLYIVGAFSPMTEVVRRGWLDWGVKVEIVEPLLGLTWSLPKAPDWIPAARTSPLVAVGLALHLFDQGRQINLLPWRTRHRENVRRAWWSGFAGVVIGAFVILITWHHFLGGQITIAKDRYAALETAQMRPLNVNQEGVLSSASVADRQRIAGASQRRNELSKLLFELASAVPSNVYLQSFQRRGQRIELKGVSQSRKSLQFLKVNLARSPSYEAPRVVEMQTVLQGGRDAHTFTLVGRTRKP